MKEVREAMKEGMKEENTDGRKKKTRQNPEEILRRS